MARIAFFSIYAFGHQPRWRGGKLTRRGHRVRYYSFSPFQKAIEAAGGECVCATPIFRLLPLMWTAR